MGISDLYGIGASGTRAYRAALGAVSENITNATTEGYNRRVVHLGESPASATTSQFFKPGVSFSGVVVTSVARNNDQYLDLAARLASGNFERADARATWLGNVQDALNDGTLGVGQRLTAMFQSVEQLAANPSDTTRRTNMLFAFEQVNTAFKQASSDLQNVKSGIGEQARNEVLALNDATGRLASTNEALRRAIPGSPNQAQLLDQRDQALADIAARVNTTVTFTDNGVANVTYGGAAMVSNIVSKPFAVVIAADGTLSYTLDGTAAGAPSTGSLAGLTGAASVLKDRVTTLDTLAVQYRDDVNTWHKNGYVTPPTTTPPSAGVKGGNMLSGSNASDLAVLITDTADIAAASSTGQLNGNLVAVNSIRGPSGVENGWTALIAAHANQLAAAQADQSASSARNQQALTAKSDVSGVDLDREAADLMRLQQAYEACARIIQVARETTQSIFSIF